MHIKRINKWLNNTNPWILLASRCNHNLKFIIASSKDSKSLIHYITKASIYTTHMNSHLQISVQKSETINNNTNLYDLINKTHHLLYDVYIQLEANKKYQPQKQSFTYYIYHITSSIMISHTYHGILYQHGQMNKK